MELISNLDWKSMFVPSGNVFEIVLRGTVVYFFLLVLLRILRREAGAVGLSDLLVVVIIADAVQNAMANEYKSITEGLVLVSTIVFWDFSLDWLGSRSQFIHRLLRPAPMLLIKDGKLLRRNMRQEMITEEELMSQLRKQGIDAYEKVKKCFLEGDGQFSIISDEKDSGGGDKNQKDRHIA